MKNGFVPAVYPDFGHDFSCLALLGFIFFRFQTSLDHRHSGASRGRRLLAAEKGFGALIILIRIRADGLFSYNPTPPAHELARESVPSLKFTEGHDESLVDEIIVLRSHMPPLEESIACSAGDKYPHVFCLLDIRRMEESDPPLSISGMIPETAGAPRYERRMESKPIM